MVEYIAAGVGFLTARYLLKMNEEKIKGFIGELQLASKLKRLKVNGPVVVMRDVLFPSRWGSSQIDAIAITRHGILVLEMKNYNAKVFGAVGENAWKREKISDDNGKAQTTTNFLGKSYSKKDPPKRHSFPSPIKQNQGHVSVIHDLLHDKYPDLKYLPLVVFSNNTELHIQNSRDRVCNLKDVNKVICRQLGPEILTDKQIRDIASTLDKNRLRGRRAKQNHLAGIELRKYGSKEEHREDVENFRKSVFVEAKNKPIYSSKGEIVQPDPSNSNRPLSELIHRAEARSTNSGAYPDQRISHHKPISR